jgi:hypothetical protein
MKAILTPPCPTGIYPAWIPTAEAVPDTPRCVIVTDGEGTWIGCYNDSGEEDLGGYWESAETEECFDSHITHWMELPTTFPPPSHHP